MPGGLSWPKYIAFVSSALISSFLGSQTVHAVYRPLEDLPEYVEKYKKERLEKVTTKNSKT